MKVALDVNVSNYVIGQIARLGDEIVCVAQSSESDHDWVGRAVDKGAEVIVSQDLDVPNLLDKWRVEGVLWFEKVEKYLEYRKKRRTKNGAKN